MKGRKKQKWCQRIEKTIALACGLYHIHSLMVDGFLSAIENKMILSMNEGKATINVKTDIVMKEEWRRKKMWQ